MRTAFIFGRFCFRNGFQNIRPVFRTAEFRRQFSAAFRAQAPRKSLGRSRSGGRVLLGALSPAAFVKLNEEEIDDGKTGEVHMLEASREELEKVIPTDVRGIRRVWRRFVFTLEQCIIEPLGTGFRFLHLLIIFVPVICTVPVIWLGGRQKDRDGERNGSLWWYGFLVRSMERAGPTFIKVEMPPHSYRAC
jgi:aarF domain-containing kinase